MTRTLNHERDVGQTVVRKAELLSRLSPHRRSRSVSDLHPIRKRPASRHRKGGLIALMALLALIYLATVPYSLPCLPRRAVGACRRAGLRNERSRMSRHLRRGRLVSRLTSLIQSAGCSSISRRSNIDVTYQCKPLLVSADACCSRPQLFLTLKEVTGLSGGTAL